MHFTKSISFCRNVSAYCCTCFTIFLFCTLFTSQQLVARKLCSVINLSILTGKCGLSCKWICQTITTNRIILASLQQLIFSQKNIQLIILNCVVSKIIVFFYTGYIKMSYIKYTVLLLGLCSTKIRYQKILVLQSILVVPC